MKQSAPMKIIKFLAAQVKGIKVIEFNPDPDVVKITGANGAGKSTVLDIIKALFTGDTMPVRKGSSKGLVNIQIGDYNVTWDLKAGERSKVTVKDSKGVTMPAPREFLQKLAGNKAIDPLCFIRMDRKDQIKTLFQLVPGLEAALKDINDRYVSVQQKRSNTLALQTKAKVDLSRMPEHLVVPEVIVCDELAVDVNRMNRQNGINKASRDNLKEVSDRITETEENIESLKAQLAAAEAVLKRDQDEIYKIGVIPEDEDLLPILDKIARAEENNQIVWEAKERAVKSEEIEMLTRTYSEQLEEMKEIEKEKADLLSDSKMPIAGLSVEGQDVMFNGNPIVDLSFAEKLRVGAAIAVSQNPEAKIILADDISLLDKTSLEILKETCKGFQLWMVQNDESGTEGIFLEDGEIGGF